MSGKTLADRLGEVIQRLVRIESRLEAPPEKETYSVAETAARLPSQRSPWTVRQWCNRGQVDGAYKIGGRGHGEWRIPHAALVRLRNEGPAPAAD
jgi:hypothetical protein